MRSMVEGARSESGVAATSSESIVVAARLRPPSDPLRPLSDALRLAIAFAKITPSTAPRSQACAGCASLPAMSGPPPPQAGEDEARGSSPRGMISFVTAGLDPAVHSDRPRIWKFSMAPSRFARSQACAGLPAMLSSLPRVRGRVARGRSPHGLPGHAPAARPGNDDHRKSSSPVKRGRGTVRSMVKGARRARSGHLFLVTAGLDPAVHSDRPRVRIRCMDCRVTPLRGGPAMTNEVE